MSHMPRVGANVSMHLLYCFLGYKLEQPSLKTGITS